MLSKIFKYDMIMLGKSLLPSYLVLLLLAFLTKGANLLTEKIPLFGTISIFITTLFVGVVICIFFYTFIVVIVRFYKSLCKEEGYLIHTLPVKKSTLVLSKILSANIYYIITFLMALIAIAITIYSPATLHTLLKVIDIFAVSMDFLTTEIIIGVLGLMILSVINNTLMVYVSICLGQTRNDKKVIYSVVYGVIVYMVSQVLASVELIILFAIHPELRTMSNNILPTQDIFIQVLGISTVLTIILTIAYYIISVKVLEHKLNLE